MSVRVLVVDDSAFARKVLREVLSNRGDLVVVGTARDGLEALEEVEAQQPDVITLDLMMPNLDGPGFLERLEPAMRRRVIVVSIAERESDTAVRALQLGAFDLVSKPTALATDRLYELSEELVELVRACAQASSEHPPAPTAPHVPELPRSPIELIAIGTSTGGPAALSQLLPALAADLPAPVLVALHIPAGYTAALARRIHELSPLQVSEAIDGEALRPGHVVVAPGGRFLTVERRGGGLVARVRPPPAGAPFAPSIDALFESAADAVGPGVLAAVLTGMGDDGLEGARRVRAAGGLVVTEDASSCVVYGMPMAVDQAGLSMGSAPLGGMAKLLLRLVRAHAS